MKTEAGPSGNDRGRLVRLLRDLGSGPVTADDDLLGLGLSSLKILQFSEAVEREFGMPVDLATLLAAPTLGELEAQLTSRSGGGPAGGGTPA